MNSAQHPVTFVNQNGLLLFGIVHEPPAERRTDLAVVLLSPGMKNRVAPHRLYCKMAAAFAARGYWVLRFDFYGLGDSEGEIGERYLADLYASIQVGRYVQDTCAAMDWMRDAFSVRRFVLGGLCGGAITGVLAAPPRDDVAGILALGLPVMLDGTNVDRYRYMTDGQLGGIRTAYLRKVLDWKSWMRLLSLKSDIRLITRSLRGVARRRTRSDSEPGCPPDNTNLLFPPAFFSLLSRGRPALLLFSEMDRLWWEFEEKFLGRHRSTVDRYHDLVEIGVVPKANHVFTLDEWQADMLERCIKWLDRHFPVPAVGLLARNDLAGGL